MLVAYCAAQYNVAMQLRLPVAPFPGTLRQFKQTGEAEMVVVLIGALLVICGVLYMAGKALGQGRLSGASKRHTMVESTTLEPRTRGAAFDLRSNWIGLVLLALGAMLLFVGGVLTAG